MITADMSRIFNKKPIFESMKIIQIKHIICYNYRTLIHLQYPTVPSAGRRGDSGDERHNRLRVLARVVCNFRVNKSFIDQSIQFSAIQPFLGINNQ